MILNVRNSANGSTPDVAVDENGVGHFVWTDSGRVGGRDGSANVVYTIDGTAPTPRCELQQRGGDATAAEP